MSLYSNSMSIPLETLPQLLSQQYDEVFFHHISSEKKYQFEIDNETITVLAVIKKKQNPDRFIAKVHVTPLSMQIWEVVKEAIGLISSKT